MKYGKTIVCFANSRKTSGRCIVGKEWRDGTPGEWVRPVSTRATHEISEEERRYEDGRDPQLLDVVWVPCESHQPLSHQRENHVIDPGDYWAPRGTLAWKDISGWLDQPTTLWGTGQGSYTGLNNRVAIGREDGSSLYLITVDRLRLLVGRKAPDYPDSKRAVRGEFSYRGATYRMDVTDPAIERNILGRLMVNTTSPTLSCALALEILIKATFTSSWRESCTQNDSSESNAFYYRPFKSPNRSLR